MNKKIINRNFLIKNSLKKIIITMKLIFIVTLLATLNVGARIYSQTTRINVNINNGTLGDVFKTIEEQSEFNIFYKVGQINTAKKVSIKAENLSITEILDKVLANEKASYTILDKIIVIRGYEETQYQSGKITGKVISTENNEPLPGVNIVVKGTNLGTTTDASGNFELNIKEEKVIIIVSFLGYVTEEMEVTAGSNITIKLVPDIMGLNEVVVIGYGTEKKSLITGSITNISGENIQNSSLTRVDQAIQGKAAGVYVLPVSGSPGSSTKIRIRGAGTNGDANPLYIVDGMKTKDITYLAPEDIASMEILKDGAASAIYGAEGGNGVVIITTKEGKTGKGNITYSMQIGNQSPGKLPDLMNAEQYAQFMAEGNLLTINPEQFKGQKGTNWLDEIFDDAPMQKHYLAFSGGKDELTFHSSLSYINQDGILGGSKANFERITGRFNIDSKLNKWIKVGGKIGYSNTKRAAITEDSEFDGLISGALMIDPITKPYYSISELPEHMQKLLDEGKPLRKKDDNTYFGISEYIQGEAVNPLIRLDISNGKTLVHNILGTSYIELNPIKNFLFTSRIGIDFTSSNRHYWNPTYYYSSERQNSSTSVVDNNYNKFSWQWENYFTYNLNINNHNATLIGGTSAEQLTYRFLNTSSEPMTDESDRFAEHAFTPGNTGTVDGNMFIEKLLSFFGRLSYDYKGKYMLQTTLRYDGASTSLLAPGHNWGVFPSFSLGWIISEESFFNIPFISFAKIRGSWGQNGSLANLRSVWIPRNDYSPFKGITQFAYQSAITTQGIRYPLPGGGYIVGAEPAYLPNPDLTWETSQQTNIGIDIKALEGKLSFTADYFIKKTKDLLVIYEPPFEAGNKPPFSNAGDVENKGFEFNLGYRKMKGDFKYNFDINLATLKNEVTDIKGGVSRIRGMRVGTSWREATSMEKGYPLWYFRGYKTSGIDPSTGNPIFVDVDKDGEITDKDQTYIGDPHPDLIYGANLFMEYKGFDFNLFLQGVSGNEILMGWIRIDRSTCNRPLLFYENRWTTNNNNASRPKANADERTFMSDQLIFDGSYMRIKQIQLGYTLPKDITGKLLISKVRLYVSLDDYFTFTKYKGMDPEAGSEEDSSLGIDRGVYPVPRKMLFGLTVSF